MRQVFADTGYWIALFLPKDDWHEAAVQAAVDLAGVQVITTDEVLTEFLTFFSAFSPESRRAAGQMVRGLYRAPEVEVVPQSRESFSRGFELYRSRLDKQYSLQDCISFTCMRSMKIESVLTPDHHFEQEGFRVLLRR